MPWPAAISQKLPQLAVEATSAGLPDMDEPAFTAFHARTAAPLLAYLSRTGGNRALAEDLSQEAYLRFLRSCRWNQGEVACRRFLFRIATNLLRDHWRRPRAVTADEIEVDQIASDAPSRGASDAGITLAPAWAQLRPRDRQLLWLAYVEGYSHREMAEITGLRAASMRLLLFRARRKMHTALTGKQS